MQMWQVPDSALKTMKWGQEQPMLSFLASQLQNPEAFLLATKQMFNRPNYETYDVWEFQHGRVFELYTRPQWISDRPVGRVFSFRDITKRLHAESALKESEERLQLSLEGSGDGLWDWKILTDEVYFSPRWLEMLGYSVGELPGNINTWQGLIHPEDQPWVMETLNTHFQDSEHPYNFDYRVLTKSGQWKWIANYGKVVTRDRHGNPMRMAGTHKDISLRKQMEEALFHEKELAQVTLHSIGDAVITTDAMGKIEYFNPVAEMLTGWNQQEAQGLPLIEVFRIFHETTREPAENPVEKALKSGQIVGLANHTVLMTRDDSEIAIDDSAAPIRDRYNQIVGAVMVFHDVTQNRNLSRQLSWQASHDSLTGLVNRHEFEQSLEQAVISARTQNLQHALCYLDLDQFKIVNDTCGHAAGDELLRQVTTLLQTKIRQTDVLARLGGDEFGVLLYQCSLEKAIGVSNILRETIQEFRFVWQDNVFSIGVSIGLVEIKADSENRVNLLSHADAACYAAKNKGRNRVHIFQSDDEELLQQRGEMQWVGRINKALAENRFCLYSQPIAAITSTATPENHYEILLRLRDEKGNIVAPMAFIPAAERYNLMPTIDRWVISTLFKHWSLVANDSKNIYAINLSGTSINDEKFIDFLHQQFSLYQVPPELICFEITETVAITNLTKASQFIRELQQCGCRFALDDFGSGMSSFAYLKTLPVDYLKIDGGFVKNIIENSVDDAMVEAITRIGHVMGLKMIAEFVENDAILQRVKALGVDYAQGFGVAKAHPILWY
ncbi:EAL domain-containing protein [Nostoc sp. KVJ3]|nr:EAL domain-containing protein [Nostoc sp. KVJ3]